MKFTKIVDEVRKIKDLENTVVRSFNNNNNVINTYYKNDIICVDAILSSEQGINITKDIYDIRTNKQFRYFLIELMHEISRYERGLRDTFPTELDIKDALL